jgi:hypothetical protein
MRRGPPFSKLESFQWAVQFAVSACLDSYVLRLHDGRNQQLLGLSFMSTPQTNNHSTVRHTVAPALSRLLRESCAIPHHSSLMSLITTNEFSLACQEQQIKTAVIQEGPSGFMLFAQLKRQPDHRTLSVDNMIRTWSSLNSLINFLHRHDLPLQEVTLRLNKETPPK